MKISQLITGIIVLIVMFTVFKEINNTSSKSSESTNSNNAIDNSKQLQLNNNNNKANLGEFPIPQSTSEEKLLTDKINPISISSTNKLPHHKISEIRYSQHNTNYIQSFYPQDNLSANTIGSSEYKFAEVDNTKSSIAWTDENVSQYPTYYTSDIKNELTDVGSFYDTNNQYNDARSTKSIYDLDDICRNDEKGNKICLNNQRLQNIPPVLITDISNCGTLNSKNIALIKDKLYNKNNISNGYPFFNKVTGKEDVRYYSTPLKQSNLNCLI